MENIYKIKFGEKMKHDIWDIWRVPGGWLFACDMGGHGISNFVPFDNEFMAGYEPVVHPPTSRQEYLHKDDPEEAPEF